MVKGGGEDLNLDRSLSRTASVVLTEEEVKALRNGLRILYRPITIHWDGQFGKFLEPAQVLLDGEPAPDVVHLMKEIDKMIIDRHGRERRAITKVESRIIKRVDEGVFPGDYRIQYDNLQSMDQCWVLVLGQKA